MNNNDKAKKILFGKDITKMMQDIPCYGVENGEGVEYEFTHENRPKHNTMDIQNEKKWYEKEGDILDALQRVCDYCNEAKISPDDLIDFHRRVIEHRRFKEWLKKDLDDYDKKHYPKE